ncbi:MAG TPA: M23 family metallopeptidase [Terriglobales bacterium]|nr:M23 family metallopeptidase [Terriglobales bacterium]
MTRRAGGGALAGLALILTMAGCGRARGTPARAKIAPAAPTASTPPAPAQPAPETVKVPPHSNFTAAVAPFHLDRHDFQQVIAAARPVYNLAHIRTGNELTLTRAGGGAPAELTYQIDDNHWLHVRRGEGADAAWTAEIQTIPYETRLAGVSGTIQSSLFGAVEAAGEHDALALQIADIFGWDLDFYTDPRQGDVFRLLVEKRYLNGKFSGYGQIVAAEYVNGGEPPQGQVYDAVRFHDDLGMLAYYRPDGRPMKREFLRSPLKFAARISSGFSENRYHPILKIYRPHLGTDFAAPTGTPVQTIGAGIVVKAGRYGGDGNMVQIRHAGGYQTLYLHLSRILVKVGERVAQGERIGLVGMTGLATGPHLDFRIEHGGSFENFEVLRKKLPPAEPVSPRMMGQFRAVLDRTMPELRRLQPAGASASADPPTSSH